MSRQYKAEAYLKGYLIVWPVGKPTRRWEARDRWHNLIASGSTRKECELNTRAAGYAPIRDYAENRG